MNFSDIFNAIKGPLASVAASLIPGGPLILGAVNALLPEDKKLPPSATGSQIVDAVESLPPEARASLMEKRIDLQIAQEEGWTDRYKAMTAADKQSTRPKIALMMAQVTCFVILIFTVAISVQIFTTGIESLASASGAWTVFATLLGIPSAVLAKYFGELRKEHSQRLGVKDQGMNALLKSIIGKVS